MENKDLICKDCIKEDVCDQKYLLEEVRKMVDAIDVFKDDGANKMTVIRKKVLEINYGIMIDVRCTKKVKKQTEFSPGWTTANIKNL